MGQDIMNIGKSIKVALATRETNQSELAPVIGIRQERISKIQNSGKCNIESLEKIATGLGYKMSEFIALGE